MRWTSREVQYFYDGLSDEEIIRKTGRTAHSVINKRRLLKENESFDDSYVRAAPQTMSQCEKEARLNKLMDRYGVRLGGTRRG